MNIDIKKKLARNWFKILQDIICEDIESLERKKNIFKLKNWKRSSKKEKSPYGMRITLWIMDQIGKLI